jgi:itaconyl-CoA hydratase/mesaconyl-C4 CoA hydratase
MNIPNPADWIGRTETVTDTLDPVLTGRVAATLGGPPLQSGDLLPSLWHWAFFIVTAPLDGLGADGHPARGGFLPPADGRNRMWAGGRVEWRGPLVVGERAERRSTVASGQEKTGRTGSLLFVTVRHDYWQGGALAITEAQDIVYRQPSPPKLTGTEPVPAAAQRQETVEPTPVLLFRYSAVTFNGHRIHYDQPYVTGAEGYPGLVVHGPLIATQMVAAFGRAHPDARPMHLAYRGLRPLIAPAPFQIAGRVTSPGQAELWAGQDGTLAHQAQLKFQA